MTDGDTAAAVVITGEPETGHLVVATWWLRSLAAAAGRWLTAVTEGVVVAAVILELAVMFGNIILRSFFHNPIQWADETAADALAVITFLGAAIAVQRGQLIAMEAVIDRLPETYRQLALAIGDWTMVATGIVICVLSQSMLVIGLTSRAPTLPINAFWTQLALPVGVAVFVVNVIRCRLARYRWKTLIIAAVIVVAAAAAVWLPLAAGIAIDSQPALFITLAALALMVVLGMPIMFAFATAAITFLVLSNTVGVSTIPPTLWNGVRDPVLLAVPFFTWAGFILAKGGLSPYLARFITNLVDHFRGGALQVVVVSMYLFSGISGSKIADMAAVSSALKDSSAREVDGQDTGAAARYTAVLNASAAMGETIPPSIGIIVVGTITSLSITSLFLAGLLPALALAICLMIVIYIQARLRHEPRRQRVPIGRIGISLIAAIPALTIPVILIGGVVGGFSTPTEVSAVAVVYSLLLALVFYRKLNWRQLWELTIETLSIAGMALFALSTASGFSFALAIAQVPQTLGTWIAGLHVGPIVFMLACALLMAVMGSVLEGLPALLIFMPLLLAPAIQVGVNPIQFAIVMLVSVGIGVHAPPLGVGFYVACMLTKVKAAAAMRPMFAYLGVLVVGLVILIVVKQTSLLLPDLFGPK
jgi:tripartite ATP-independent transporter DctM subunit